MNSLKQRKRNADRVKGPHPKVATRRRRTRRALAARILAEVRNHPANFHAPNRSVLRSIRWQLGKRLRRGKVRINAYGLDLEFPRDSGSLSNYFYFGEFFEWETINFVDTFLREGDVVVDVGANVGMFSYAALRRVGATGHIYCFEPMPGAARVIQGNVARNGATESVTLHRLAASNRAGTVAITADLDVSNHVVWTNAESISQESLLVETARLDEILPASRQLALVKIDVEGAELLALQGLEARLQQANPPVLVLEAHDHSLRKLGASRADVLQLLHEARYQCFEYDVATRSLRNYEEDSTSDMIAVHATQIDWVAERLSGEVRSGARG